MRSGKTLLFALAVLLLCSLFATMMSTHYVAEGFAPNDPTTAALTPAQIQAQLETLQKANSTAATPMTPIQMAKMQQNQANIQALPPGMQPAFPPEFLAKNNITDPIGSPLNPSNDQMRVVTDFYNNNPTKKPPASLSLRDQLMFNVSVLPLDQLTAFKNLGQVAATNANMANNPLVMMNAPMPMPSTGGPMSMPVEVAPDAPTTSWSRNGVQIVTNVPQKCTPFVQQTMEADGNYFGARVPAGIPQNAMSFPPASYSYTGPPTATSFVPGSAAYAGPPLSTSFVPESATFKPTLIQTPIPTPIPTPIQPAATKPPPLTIAQQPFVPSSTPITR